MKVFWIGGLLSLLMVVAWFQVSARNGGSLRTAAGAPGGALAAPAAPQNAGGNAPLTAADYVLLHQTRREGGADELPAVNAIMRN